MKACNAAVALVAAALAAAGYRGNLLWCGARGIPLGTFWRCPGFAADQMPSMDGMVALVTGANAGLGLEVSRQLLRANATVVLACRDVAKCEAAAQTLRAEAAASAVTARPDVRVVHVDLSDLRQVGRAAQTLDAELGALDLLVANAYATQGSNPGLADPRQVCYSHVWASPLTGELRRSSRSH